MRDESGCVLSGTESGAFIRLRLRVREGPVVGDSG